MRNGAATILALEDETYRVDVLRELFAPHTVYATDFVADFLDQARRGSWRLILMDHDLSHEPDAPNGCDAARALADASAAAFSACCYVPVVVHSLNLVAAGAMVQALWSWEAPVIRLPFHRLAEYAPWLVRLIG